MAQPHLTKRCSQPLDEFMFKLSVFVICYQEEASAPPVVADLILVRLLVATGPDSHQR
jgi:hypothetical protein